jgi:hypothetical protein
MGTHDIDVSRPQPIQPLADDRAKSTLHPVADDGMSDRLRHHEADLGSGAAARVTGNVSGDLMGRVGGRRGDPEASGARALASTQRIGEPPRGAQAVRGR